MNVMEQDLFVVAWDQAAEEVHGIAREKGWWDSERNDGEIIALIHSELSEALDAMRDNAMDRHCPEFSGVAVELADVIIRIMDFAKARGIPVAEALNAKVAFNATRPHRHGGKAF